jgi:hypothetical protein
VTQQDRAGRANDPREHPADATHWSTRAIAKRSGLRQTIVSRIWRAFAVQPHRVETFKLSKDPLLVEKVRDIVGWHHPPDKALVLWVDEKAQIQALDRSQPLLPMRPGQAPSAAAMIPCVTAPPTCSPHSTPRPAGLHHGQTSTVKASGQPGLFHFCAPAERIVDRSAQVSSSALFLVYFKMS